MNARILLRLAFNKRRAAAEPATNRTALRAEQIARRHECVTDSNGVQHLAPIVYCARELPGHRTVKGTEIKGAIR
ncbi:hypothetical protein [Nevskia sp.]|uniref:hypothetical protein n=1 Tax=Nevskia sp. TaxID=1929292 RepID=UPI0025E35641|nr:hypothetical protein [Nevskia sp.]